MSLLQFPLQPTITIYNNIYFWGGGGSNLKKRDRTNCTRCIPLSYRNLNVGGSELGAGRPAPNLLRTYSEPAGRPAGKHADFL